MLRKLLLTALVAATSLSIYGQQATPFKDSKSGKFGLKDKQGNLILKAKYDTIAAEPSIGCYIVKKKDKYGLVDKTGKEEVRIEYRDMYRLISDGKTESICFLNSVYPNLLYKSTAISPKINPNIEQTINPKWIKVNDYIYQQDESEPFKTYVKISSGTVRNIYFDEKSGNGYLLTNSLYPYSNGKLLEKWVAPVFSYEPKGNIDKFKFQNATSLFYMKDSGTWCVAYSPGYDNYVCDLSGQKFGKMGEDGTVVWSSDPQDRIVDGVIYKYADGQWSVIDPKNDKVLFSVNGEKEKNPLKRYIYVSKDKDPIPSNFFTYTVNGKVGVYRKGSHDMYERILEVQYDSILLVNDRIVCVYSNNGKIGVYYPELKKWAVKAGVYDFVAPIKETGSSYHFVGINGKYGVVDRDGKEIIAPQYGDKDLSVGATDGGIYTFNVWNSAKQIGVINQKGKQIVPYGRYDKIVRVHGPAKIIIGKKNGKVGATEVDNGAIVAPTIYDVYEGAGTNGNYWFSTGTTSYILNKKGAKVASTTYLPPYQMAVFIRKHLNVLLPDVGE